MAALQPIAKAVLWLHSTLYRLTNGRFIAGSPILLLTTTGRRTGKRRIRPLADVRDGDRFVLCVNSTRSLGQIRGLSGHAAGADYAA